MTKGAWQNRLRDRLTIIWLDGWGTGIVFLLALAAVAAIWIAYFNPQHYTRDGYVIADVKAVFDVTSESNIGFRVHVILPNNQERILRTTSLFRLGGVGKIACLLRLSGDKGATDYRIVKFALCET